jgi:hypothetical protein
MKDKFPRTASEFADHGREVVVRCPDCDRYARVDPAILVLTFGEDFDCYDNLAELTSQLRCDACGEPHRIVFFRNANEKSLEPTSFEQSVINNLEFNAFLRARNGDSDPHRRLGRPRRAAEG